MCHQQKLMLKNNNKTKELSSSFRFLFVFCLSFFLLKQAIFSPLAFLSFPPLMNNGFSSPSLSPSFLSLCLREEAYVASTFPKHRPVLFAAFCPFYFLPSFFLMNVCFSSPCLSLSLLFFRLVEVVMWPARFPNTDLSSLLLSICFFSFLLINTRLSLHFFNSLFPLPC